MKERLDIILVNRNLVSSRQKAKAIIMAGNVFVNGQKETKAGTSFADTVEIEIKGKPLKYVSRGGFKLEKAIEEFDKTYASMHGCWFFNRWIHRLHVTKWCQRFMLLM